MGRLADYVICKEAKVQLNFKVELPRDEYGRPLLPPNHHSRWYHTAPNHLLTVWPTLGPSRLVWAEVGRSAGTV